MTEPVSFRYHHFDVPIDWSNADFSDSMKVFVREILDKDGASKPPILFLQGGPGFQAQLPTDEKWILQLMTRFRVFLLDQRGTGMSTPIDLTGIIERDAASRSDAVEYLTHFRADSIARDVEHIRRTLFAGEDFYTYGQSFGGWCTHAYLSLFPTSPKACLITGGFPGIGHGPLESYRALVPQVDKTNEDFLSQYTETQAQLEHLIDNLDDDTLLALAQSGFWAGYSSQHANLRGVIESLYFDLETIGRPSIRSRRNMFDPLGFTTNPLYALLHEPLYCEGRAPSWAADTVMLHENNRPSHDNITKFFLAENVYRNYFEVVPELIPLAGLMDAVMTYSDWGQLYNVENLAQSEVPVVGSIYTYDAAVVTSYAHDTAALLGNGHVVESDLDHHANRTHADVIFPQLFAKLDEVS